MAFSIKLQSPKFDANGNGSEVTLPASVDVFRANSLATILTLFNANNLILDFGQLREVVTLQGFLTDEAADDATYRLDGSSDARVVANAVHWRDILRQSREGSTAWARETVTASTNWGSGTLPADEQDSATSRTDFRLRLILDKQWDRDAVTGTAAAGTSTTQVVLAGDHSGRADSVLRNTTRTAERRITTAVYDGSTNTTITLQSAITGQTSGDSVEIGDFENLFLYGTVGDFQFQRPSATLRHRIPFTLTFLVGKISGPT